MYNFNNENKIIGLDFGTTYSFPAFKRKDSENYYSLIPVNFKYGIPSLIYVNKDGSFAFGEKASNKGASALNRLIRSIKRNLFDENKIFAKELISVDSQTFTLEHLVTSLLQHIVNVANESSNSQLASKQFNEIVLTVPVGFGDMQKNFLNECAKNIRINGKPLQIVAFLQEPVAAGLYYLTNKDINVPFDKNNPYIAVLDIGGGTTDVTVLKYVNDGFKDNFEVVSQGMEELGGDDWDEELFNLIRIKLENKYPELIDIQELEELIRKELFDIKCELSEPSKSKVNVNIGYYGEDYDVDVTLEEFELSTRHLLNQALSKLKKVIDESNKPINQILLVGGSCNMKQVKSGVSAYYPNLKNKIYLFQPEHAIGFGAAQYASLIERTENGGVIFLPDKLVNIHNQTHFSYGVTLLDDNEKEYVKNLIKKGEATPIIERSVGGRAIAEKDYIYTTIWESVFDDDTYYTEEPGKGREIGKIRVDLDYIRKVGDESILFLEIDASNQLIAYIKDKNTGKESERKKIDIGRYR